MQKIIESSPVQKAFTLACAFVLLFALSGCSASQEEATQAEKDLASFGEQTESSFAMKITNDTEKEIKAIAVQPTWSAEGTKYVAEAGIMPGDQFIVYAEKQQNAEKQSNTDIALKDLLDLEFNFAEGDSVKVHDVGDIAEFSLLISPDGIGYIEYTVDGSVENTLLAETDSIAAEKEAKAAEKAAKEAEKAAQEDEKTAQEATDNAAVPEEEPAYSYDYDESSGDTSVAQEEDQCVDDVVLR